MQDLNDLYYFSAVVDHGGFAAAERAMGIPKSRLSRRISALEAALGVRLLQRSTRRFAVTDVGTSVHRHAQAMLAEAQAAREVVDRLSAEPRGSVRVSVPVSMAQQQMPKLLPEFMARHPKVRVLALVAEGLLNKQIADRLDVQERTVKAHLTAIFERLGVRNRTQASVVLRELELSDPARQMEG